MYPSSFIIIPFSKSLYCFFTKKAERIKSGEFISICRGKIKRKPENKYFTIRRGEFIVNFN